MAIPRPTAYTMKYIRSGGVTPRTLLLSPLKEIRQRVVHILQLVTICASEPQNAHEYVPSCVSQSACRANKYLSSIYKISFACWAGIQVIQSQQLANMPNNNKIVAAANKLA